MARSQRRSNTAALTLPHVVATDDVSLVRDGADEVLIAEAVRALPEARES